tara:strand:- start:8 stop:1054 length:1047 start_codon:yes stop_codon:yes gene_type:complete
MSLDEEWLQFKNSISSKKTEYIKQPNIVKSNMPKCSDIYISTQTKIVFLNVSIDLHDIYWKIPIISYSTPKNGVIKKSIKINCNTLDEVKILEKKIKEQKKVDVNILSQINEQNKNRQKFKDIRKINIGISKRDLISYKSKIKGAFYNCFALIYRLFYKNKYKEIHIKVFNTGKLEIPGIQEDELLILVLKELTSLLCLMTNNNNITYSKKSIQTVLINSNFTCKFFINRYKLFKLLKYKYKIHTSYDPCSYPGIQSKFAYHPKNSNHNGIYDTSLFEKGWRKISFMIFRTGSVLIVGNCTRHVLYIIYDFIKKIFAQEYNQICIENNNVLKNKKKRKLRKKTILISN